MEDDGVVKKLEQKNLNKSKLPLIITCIVISLVIIVGGLWLLYAFALPGRLANFAYNINMESYALKLYMRDYDKNKDVNSLYMALNIEIKHNNSDGIVEKYETFSNLAVYYDFVKKVDEDNLKLDEQPIVKASLLNEDNYLKNRYIKALVDLKKNDKAFDYAVSVLMNLEPTSTDLGNYVFGSFCDKEVVETFVEDFNVAIGGYDNRPLINVIESYFDKLDAEFENYLNFDKTYVYAMGNRIMEVGADLLELYKSDKLGGSRDSEHVTSVMEKVTKNFKILAMG